MRVGHFSAALMPLLGIAAALPTGPGQISQRNDDIQVAHMNASQIADYNSRGSDLAQLYPRLVHGSQFSRRGVLDVVRDAYSGLVTLLKGPKPGIAYAPFRDDGGCKSAEEVMKDVEDFRTYYSFIRIYGPACSQVEKVHEAAKKWNMKLFLGVFDHENVGKEVKDISDQLKGDWSLVDTVSIGNELMLKGLNAEKVMGKLAEGREALKGVGYHPDKVKHAKIVLTEVWWHSLSNPQFCDGSDYCAVNFHPYFDENHGPDKAGQFMLDQVKIMRDKMKKNKRIHITETGWPTQDDDPSKKGKASVENQKSVLKQIKDKLDNKDGELILFSPFDDKWKGPKDRPGHVEKWWGIRR